MLKTPRLELSEEEELIRKTARDFADRELAPLASSIDRNAEVPRSILKKMAELGFMGMLIPDEYGGAAMGNFALSLVQQEINRACASTGITMSVHNSLTASPIIRFGNDEQKKKCLRRMATAEWIGAYSLSEPSSGTDAAALRTTAVRDGDDYVLNGSKNFVTNGAIADLFVLFARTDPEAKKTRGISAFLVERSRKGLTVGKSEKKLGIRGSSTTQLFLEECRVPAENLLGKENQGFRIALNTLDGGRVGIASQAVGIAEACLQASIQYSKERKQFDRPISDFQAIRWKLANLATEIDAARLLTYRAARLRDAGLPHTKEASMAKLFAADMVNRHATQAIQIHGGVGYTKDFPVERYFRDAKVTEIYEGTSEVQRIVISRELLK